MADVWPKFNLVVWFYQNNCLMIIMIIMIIRSWFTWRDQSASEAAAAVQPQQPHSGASSHCTHHHPAHHQHHHHRHDHHHPSPLSQSRDGRCSGSISCTSLDGANSFEITRSFPSVGLTNGQWVTMWSVADGKATVIGLTRSRGSRKIDLWTVGPGTA